MLVVCLARQALAGLMPCAQQSAAKQENFLLWASCMGAIMRGLLAATWRLKMLTIMNFIGNVLHLPRPTKQPAAAMLFEHIYCWVYLSLSNWSVSGFRGAPDSWEEDVIL